ncbi:MAG: MerR family transcriptional regulator [Oscillospiraceae bacterium]|nr:MerR family transcriptional regulator [Oscillospiraceae bacterium]
MNGLLLREICELAGVTRRAVQGYEKFNLVAPAGKNKMGYLLYDESTIEKIKQIRQFQKRSFSLREISLLNRLSTDELKRVLEKKIDKLMQDSADIQTAILALKTMLENI